MLRRIQCLHLAFSSDTTLSLVAHRRPPACCPRFCRLITRQFRAPNSAGDKDISTADAPSPSRGSAKPAACWHMKGRLTSAESGRTIALVEGVELARSLAFEVGDRGRRGGYGDSSNQHDHDDGRELEVDRVLRKPGMWNAFGVLASSKFFMYQVGSWGGAEWRGRVDVSRRGIAKHVNTMSPSHRCAD